MTILFDKRNVSSQLLRNTDGDILFSGSCAKEIRPIRKHSDTLHKAGQIHTTLRSFSFFLFILKNFWVLLSWDIFKMALKGCVGLSYIQRNPNYWTQNHWKDNTREHKPAWSFTTSFWPYSILLSLFPSSLSSVSVHSSFLAVFCLSLTNMVSFLQIYWFRGWVGPFLKALWKVQSFQHVLCVP